MSCCLGRKYKNLYSTFLENIQFFLFMIQWIMTEGTILEDILLADSVIWKI